MNSCPSELSVPGFEDLLEGIVEDEDMHEFREAAANESKAQRVPESVKGRVDVAPHLDVHWAKQFYQWLEVAVLPRTLCGIFVGSSIIHKPTPPFSYTATWPSDTEDDQVETLRVLLHEVWYVHKELHPDVAISN